ncbi:unnamed protein product [Rhizophagus irregularis]|nr:unnamed protein product [Rhizophagus irregularis]
MNLDNENNNLLKEFLKGFYRQIIKIDNYNNFENILIDWVQDYLINNELNHEKILKLMEDHEENENWFSGLIGFFYDYDLINDNDLSNLFNDEDKSLKLYLLSINKYTKKNDDDEINNNLISIYQLLNIIISKYLLSFYYYKDIILNKRDLIIKEFKNLEEKKHTMSYNNQFENFNGLEINLCKDEINIMEEYFESKNKYCSNNNNENQIDYDKKKELIELNNLAKGGNIDAQNNLGYCYQNGIGIIKDEKKAFEWYSL